MSSHATEGAEAAGEPAVGAAIPAEPAETSPADTAPGDAAMGSAADGGAVAADATAQTPVTSAVPAGTPSPELAVADAGAMTLVLDPEPAGDDNDRYPDEPVSKLAVAALVTSVIALVPVAIACAVAALVGIRRSGRRGHGMATSALFLSAAWVIVAGAVGAVGVLTHGFHKPVTIKYHEAAVFKLQTGDCVSSTSSAVVSLLPCYTPHEAEVFATFSLPATAWPGTATVAQDASSGCGDRLSGYLNPELAISLTQSYVYPDEVAWTAGTRTVICEVRATSGQLTSSVRGAS